jgi:hypothetical protein
MSACNLSVLFDFNLQVGLPTKNSFWADQSLGAGSMAEFSCSLGASLAEIVAQRCPLLRG